MQLYTTYSDMGEVPPDRSWSYLRALRAAPPGLAAKNDRRRVFVASLEQAEQLFRAAESVGIATKPLLAFYGLSQAGRAIAAALAPDDWRLTGHGIGAGNSPGRVRRLADFTVDPIGRRGAFSRMCEILESSALGTSTRVGDLWPLLHETNRHPLPGCAEERSLSVTFDRTTRPTGIPSVRVQELPGRFADVGQENRQLMSGLGADYVAQADALDRFLARYPTLSQRERFTIAGQPVGLQPSGNGTCSVVFKWPELTNGGLEDKAPLGTSVGILCRGSLRVYPSLDGSNRAVHPLVIWWALMFRLSILARYEPEAWDHITDINESEDAVPTEHLLRSAMSSVPELIFNVLAPQASG